MTAKTLRDLLYEMKDDDQIEVCNINAPVTRSLPVADITLVKQGLPKETQKSKLLIMFDTQKDKEKEW